MHDQVYLWGAAGLGAGLLAGSILTLVWYRAFVMRQLEERIDGELRERKDQFIALASHYLFNPITIIQTAVISLQEKSNQIDPTERDRLYQTIVRGQQRLWILAEQLLLVGQIDHDELRLRLTVANLSELVSGAVTAVDVFAREKKVALQFHDETPDVQEARVDARLMKQAVIAIVDNAIKFSLEGGTVFVTLQTDRNVITIWVQDNGIGMPEEVVKHLSEKFYRGTSLYDFNYEGLGLGLHVAMAIVRQHGGTLTFTSQADQGTAVAIRFPNL